MNSNRGSTTGISHDCWGGTSNGYGWWIKRCQVETVAYLDQRFLTPWSRFVLGKLLVLQLANMHSPFHGTWKLIAAFVRTEGFCPNQLNPVDIFTPRFLEMHLTEPTQLRLSHKWSPHQFHSLKCDINLSSALFLLHVRPIFFVWRPK